MEKLLQDLADFIGHQWAQRWLEQLRQLEDGRIEADAHQDRIDGARASEKKEQLQKPH
jgi:hypothetical protein